MSDTDMLSMLAFVLVVAIIAAVIIWDRHKTKARIAAMTPEEHDLYEAEREYQKLVSAAASTMAATQRQYDYTIKNAERNLQHAQRVGTNELAKYSGRTGWVRLHENRIETPQGTALFENGPVIATVDTAGGLYESRRSTFTRVAAGGLLFGPVGAVVGAIAKKRTRADARELYLLVESPVWGVLVQCKPDDGARVRDLAMRINAASRNADNARAAHDYAVAQATASLETARLNTAPLDEAKRMRAAAEADTGQVDRARAALAAAEATANQPQQGGSAPTEQ